MKFFDFFAGIGGFRRGMELAGHECVGFCEYDKFAYGSYVSMHLLTEEQRERLMTMPKNKRIKEIGKEEYRNGEWYARDIREIRAAHVPRAECWCFGFPCQDISVAGKQLGFRGERSSLFFAVMRIIQDTKEEDRPTYLFIENVKNLLSVNGGTDFLKLLIALDEAGYDAEWQVLNSADFGVPQSRERVFIIGHLRGRCTKKIFPVQGQVGKGDIKQVGNYLSTKTRDNPNQGHIYDPSGISPCLNKMDGGGREPSVVLPSFCDMSYGSGGADSDKAYCLMSRYYKGMSNRKKEATGVMVAGRINGSQDGKIFKLEGYSQCLSAGNNNQPKVICPVATPEMGKKNQNGRRIKESEEPMFTLTAKDRHGIMISVKEATKKGYDVANVGDSINLSIPNSKTRRGRVGKEIANTLDTGCNQGVVTALKQTEENIGCIWNEEYGCYVCIRKLTPKECFRLQGWEDIYFERAEMVNSDSQLYKQAGNGVTVNVIEAIAKKMEMEQNG